jgi:hypothetical protein
MIARFLALFLAVSGVAWGGGHEFDEIVKAIERNFGTRRTHIPLMGVANLVTKAARPAGTSGFKLAIFEDLKGRGDDNDLATGMAKLDQFMNGLTPGGLQPVVRAHSRHGEAATYIYAGEVGRSPGQTSGQTSGQTTRLLIVTFDCGSDRGSDRGSVGGSEGGRATVIEVNVPVRTLMQLLESPDQAAKMFGQ